MFITAARLLLLAQHVPFTTAEALAPLLDERMPAYGIITMLGRAHFMAQACWESSQFRRFDENLTYTAERIAHVWPRLAPRAFELAGKSQALANAAYAMKNGNADEASGDGWRFHGRGMFQLTGRANYTAAGYAGTPEAVAAPIGAVTSALWFWKVRGCNDAANNDDAEAVTRLINGPACEGLAQRRELTETAKPIFA